jgi:MYXO-CTERM domain-containing protein
MRRLKITIIVLLVLAPLSAHAQVVFPGDSAYVPLRCGNAVMTDGFADESGALNERDIVGDSGAAAGLRASDDTNLYLRMRLEEDPAPAGAVTSFSWGMEFDLDDDVNDYELLILVDGMGGAGATVQIFRNTTTTLNNDPNDPADQPAAQTYTFANNARTITSPGSNYGGSADFFLDFAVPWSALIPLGLDHDTPTHVWAASSSSANSLNGDFACHAGGTGAATLSGTASDDTTGDPNDPGGGGGSGRLEGGGGCSIGGGGGGHAGLALALLGLLLRRRRAR